MPEKKARGAADERRAKLRDEFWPDEDAWTGEGERGWFRAPRTLPLILALLRSKQLSGNCDPSSVYAELLARHIGQGVIEMSNEGDHAYAAGYGSSRGIQTWRERMKLLEQNGFIKARKIGNQRYKYVLLVHPTTAVHRLREASKVPNDWWDTYRARQAETKEASHEDREKAKRAARIVPIKRLEPA
jgi:hypothetical protein